MHKVLAGIDESYRAEIFRKAIHLCSLLIPIFYFFLSKRDALTILIPLTVFTIGLDIARYYSKPYRDFFLKTFGFLLRKHETDGSLKRLNGASYVLISATLCVLVFPKIITISCFSVLIISDLTAALIGKRFGKHPFFSKSLEGSLAFLFSGFLVILFTPKADHLFLEYAIGFIAVVIGMFVEASSIPVDDNLSIPITVGASMWLLYILSLPFINIYILG